MKNPYKRIRYEFNNLNNRIVKFYYEVKEMKQVYETNDEVELQMLIGLLESNGIYTQIYTDGAGDYLRIKGSDFMIPKGVLVKDKDWKEALEIINANGFGKKKKVKRVRTQIWAARIALVLFLAAILGNIIYSLIGNL